MNTLRRSLLVTLGCCAAAVPAFTQAQAYPAKPIKLVVPFVPGGGADTIARLVSSHLQQRLGQPVLVENKPGAGGAVAADAVAKAAPDGYTLMIMTNTFVTNAAITKTPYDPVRDFTPITTLGTSPYLLLVNANSEYKTVADLLKAGKAQPDKLSYGSAGPGGITHLLGELLKQRGQFTAQHVPYKGTAAAITDLIGGQIQFAFADTAAAVPQVKSGKLRALATTAPARSPVLPDVPPLNDAGVKLEVVGFYGLLGPAKLPQPIAARLNTEMAAVLGQQDVKDRFAAGLTDALAMPQDQFTRMLGAEVVLWRDVVKASGSKFD